MCVLFDFAHTGTTEVFLLRRAQYAVLTKVLGVKKAYAVIGFSMGGQQVNYIAIVVERTVERRVKFLKGISMACILSGLCREVNISTEFQQRASS